MDPTVVPKVFDGAGGGRDLTTAQALERFKQGRASLRYLLDHYDEISAGGGDNVRRYLGTVGVGSGLYGIGKVLRALQKEDDNGGGVVEDVVEFNELSEELISAINRADGSAYMSIFATFSSGSTPPKKYFDDARTEVGEAVHIMDGLAAQLNVVSK